VASVFAANPTLASFTMGRLSPDLAPETVNTLEEVGRISIGAKGEIGPSWTFDTSLAEQYTVNNLDVIEPIKRNLYAAADAVVNSAGQTVCNSTLQGLDAGCVPINLFGVGAASAAAKNYVLGNNRGDTIFRQTNFEANLRGVLPERWSFGAGPLSLATGVAYRSDSADRSVDALSTITTSCAGLRGCPASYNASYGGYQYYNPGPLKGSTNSKEAYFELGVPLLKDLPLVKSLNADFAGRWTDYSVSGSQYTYKIGLQWQVDSSIKFRATNSEDVRAPDALELFSTASTKVSFDLFPSSTAPTTLRVSAVNASTGNPNLGPEIAHTSTVGIVLSPSWLSGFQTSVDYYKVGIAHSIEALVAQGVVDGCAAGNKSYCQLITVGGAPITSVSQITASTTGLTVTGPRANVGNESTSGIDVESAYTRPLGEGTLTARAIANFLLTVQRPTAITGCAQTNLVGAIGGCLGQDGFASWKGNLSLDYHTPRFGVFVQERLISSGKADPWDVIGVTVNRNAVPLVAYTDMTLDYAVGSLFHVPGKVYLNVTNLFDTPPPPTIISAGAFDAMTSYDVYDVLGRRFVLGYKINF
jgi:outer membrane receptor protein involved in Fe transport